MHQIKITNKKISDKFWISKIAYPIFSYSNIYKKASATTESFEKRYKNSKDIEVTFVLEDTCSDYLKKQHDIESFAANELLIKEPTWADIDGRFALIITDDINMERLYDNLVTVTYKNLLGSFYSEEKSISLPGNINLHGIEDTDVFAITLIPTSNVELKNISTGQGIYLTDPAKRKIDIDFLYKTISSAGQYVPLDLNSRFFMLKLGDNNISLKGASGSLKYREVLSL